VTPEARVSAAIEILDLIGSGRAAEQVLTNWARSNRYAGSGDRAAIRDFVFDAIRCRRSFGWLGGANSGRALMIGSFRAAGIDPDRYFNGERFAPPRLTDPERTAPEIGDAPRAIRLDCPDWLMPVFEKSLGDRTDAVLSALQSRAPIFLRVNTRKTSVQNAIAELNASGIHARPHSLSPTALQVVDNPRRVQTSRLYIEGAVEFQDVASQAIVDLIPLSNNMKVLDYCAGGGGKSLALAARADLQILCYDANPKRMQDLPDRAKRAGVKIAIAKDKSAISPAGYDLVLCDVPCSGSGAWRRSPEAKWTLTPERLAELVRIQSEILDEASDLVNKNGMLAYATCSLIDAENRNQIDQFVSRNSGWSLNSERQLTPLDGGDGFYIALLTRT